jgi:hypothetical protein
MTAKQKANELVDKYLEYVEAYSSQGQLENAKICALIAVNEILLITWVDSILTVQEFWQEVKREIKAIKS